MQGSREVRRRAATWLSEIESSSTRDAYRRDLEVFVSWLDEMDVTPLALTSADLHAFRLHCEAAGSSAATVRRRLAAVSSFYRAHVADGAANPMAGVQRPARPASSSRMLGEADLAALWEAARATGGKSAVLLGLVLFDGFTMRAALDVDVDDVAVGGRSVWITTDDVRIELDRRTAAAVRVYLDGRVAGPLLLGDRVVGDAQRLTRFGVDYLVKQVALRAGVPGPVTVNLLRRSVAGRNG